MKNNIFNIDRLLRKNIKSLVPYSSARDEYKGEEAIFLDANENPFNAPYNRYPDPQQFKLKQRIAEIKGTSVSSIFLGNGSDEAIDLLIRAFCEPGIDNILSFKPTYGMYKVCADINHVEFREVLLKPDYQIDTDALLQNADSNSKLMYLCSPNNPTSNSMNRNDLLFLLESFKGIVVVDEAYIDFSASGSLLPELRSFPNLVVLQTFSKAWGLAGIRLGLAFASKEIIDVLTHIKYPYNINFLTQTTALKHLSELSNKETWIRSILEQREVLRKELSRLPMVKKILPSDANFLMVKFDNPQEILAYLMGKKIIVRDRSRVVLCEGYLRITVGTPEENKVLVSELQRY
jgi:histidinol-phosphate aminotransferase